MANLLKEASILLTPTAYNDGKMLSVKPNENLLGSELVTNGDFSTDSDWVKGTGWSISNGTALHTGAASYLTQSILEPNKQYKVRIKVLQANGSNFVQIYMGNSPASVLIQDVGEYEYIFTSQSIQSLGFALRGVGDIEVDNVSVKEDLSGDFDFTRNSAATRVNAQGLVDSVSENLPRINYEGGCGSWLLEPQSTNLIKNSEPTAQESAANGITYESFDWSVGFTNCVKFTNINNSYWYGGTVLPETQYTLSVFIIMDDLSQPQAGLGASNDFYMPIGNASTTSYSYQDFGNNVWRVKGTQTSSAINLNNSGIRKLSNSSKGFRVVGWQLEEGSFATSYIPTSGAISTRLRDLADNSGDASLINSTEGVLYFEGKMMENAPVSYVSISDGTGSVNNNLNISFRPSTNTVWWRVQVGGSASVSLIVGLSDMFSNTKLALKWKENDFSLWENGNKISFDTLGSVFPLNTLNTIDLHQANGLSSFNSELKAIAVFKTALTDEQLTALTKI